QVASRNSEFLSTITATPPPLRRGEGRGGRRGDEPDSAARVPNPHEIKRNPHPPKGAETAPPRRREAPRSGAMVVRRLGGAGRALLTLPNIRRRASNSWAAVRDTFLSTKQVFESHRIVFTIGTSIASIFTAWGGYSLHHWQQSRFHRKLESLETTVKDNHRLEHEEIKRILASRNISTPACIATAMTTMVIGYWLGWRGGAWYAQRAFLRQQQKLMMGHMKSHGRWQWRPFNRLKNRLRRASKSKSEDAHRSLAQSADAPLSSGASANVSSTAQPAAGSA
ncbi:unnamed protein product, partial [Urochloa humidicola]